MSNSVDDGVQRAKHVFGEHLRPQELEFLRETQRFFKTVLERRHGFQIAVEIVAAKLKSFLQTVPAERLRFAFDAQMFKETFPNDSQRIAEASTPLTEEESSFCADVDDAIEFVLQNGIGFGLIAGSLSHDLNEILLAGSLEKAIFNPKVSGWARYNRALIGVAPEEDQ